MHIKKPGGGHKIFRILTGKPTKTVHCEELTAINKEYLEGRIDRDKAAHLVRALAKQLTPKRPTSYLPENGLLAQAYWEARIKPKRKNVAPWEAKRRVFWGVSQLGATPLLGSTEEQLYEALSHLKPRSKQRCASVLNAILRWKGVEKFVHVERVSRSEPRYLTLQELLSFSLPHKEWQLCVLAAFATGARYGELFTITEVSLREEGSHVLIMRQMKRSGEVCEVKNRKTGAGFVIPELREALVEWAKLPMDIKREMRMKELPGEYFKWAADKALHRHLTFHNLRHSYARCMLTRNEGLWEDRDAATLEDLRQWMRDQLSTVEHYYTSWVVTNSQMRSNVKRFG